MRAGEEVVVRWELMMMVAQRLLGLMSLSFMLVMLVVLKAATGSWQDSGGTVRFASRLQDLADCVLVGNGCFVAVDWRCCSG